MLHLWRHQLWHHQLWHVWKEIFVKFIITFFSHDSCSVYSVQSLFTFNIVLPCYRLQIYTDCLTYTPVDSNNYQHLLNPILREANSKISLKNIVYGEKEEVKNETNSKTKRKRKKKFPSFPISCNQPACLSLHLISSLQFLDLRKSYDHCNIMYIFRTQLFQDLQGHSNVLIYHTSAQHSTYRSRQNSSQITNPLSYLKSSTTGIPWM